MGRARPSRATSVPIPRSTPRSAAPARTTARAGAAGTRSRRSPRQHKVGRPPGPAGPSDPRCPWRPPRRCRPGQRSGRRTPCSGGTPSPRAKGRGTASRATRHGQPRWAGVRVASRSRAILQQAGSLKSKPELLDLVLIWIDFPDAKSAYSMSRNPKAHERLAIIDRTPSKRARTARSSSRVRATGRRGGSLARSTACSRRSLFQYLAVQEHDRVHRLVPSRRGHLALDGQTGHQLLHLGRPQVRRMSVAMEQDEPPEPNDVSLLGTSAPCRERILMSVHAVFP